VQNSAFDGVGARVDGLAGQRFQPDQSFVAVRQRAGRDQHAAEVGERGALRQLVEQAVAERASLVPQPGDDRLGLGLAKPEQGRIRVFDAQ
jgi:hypothetical protein